MDIIYETKVRRECECSVGLTLANGRCLLRAGACLERSERADRR